MCKVWTVSYRLTIKEYVLSVSILKMMKKIIEEGFKKPGF